MLVSEHVDGCLVEAGPDSFLTEKPWAAQLCREVGLGDQIIGSNDAQRGQNYDPQRSHFYRNGHGGYGGYGNNGRYGGGYQYEQAYRQGFLQGYDQGFRRNGGYNNRRNNGNYGRRFPW